MTLADTIPHVATPKTKGNGHQDTRVSSTGRTIKVLIADPQPVVRAGLHAVLTGGGIEVVGEASTSAQAQSYVQTLQPDVVVLELTMEGVSLTKAIKQVAPNVEVLILTGCTDDYLSQAFSAGVSGYLLKDSDPEQIRRAVLDVYGGRSPISPSLTRDLVLHLGRLARASQTTVLNEREKAILALIAKGRTGREVAVELFMSTSTVKREMRRIYDKLGVNDRAHAVAVALMANLI